MVLVDLEPSIVCSRRSGAHDEVIIHDVVSEIRARVRRVPCRVIVEQVIHEDRVRFGEGVPVVRIGKNIAVPRPVTGNGFRVRAELLARWVSNQRILKRDVRNRVVLPIVTHPIDIVPRCEFQRRVIHNDVLGSIEAERVVFGAYGFAPWADANVATNNIRLIGKRYLATSKSNSSAWRRLARNSNVTLHRYRGNELDVATDVENDEAIRRAHGITKRAGAGVIEIRHVIDSAVAGPGRILSEPLSFGESQ